MGGHSGPPSDAIEAPDGGPILSRSICIRGAFHCFFPRSERRPAFIPKRFSQETEIEAELFPHMLSAVAVSVWTLSGEKVFHEPRAVLHGVSLTVGVDEVDFIGRQSVHGRVIGAAGRLIAFAALVDIPRPRSPLPGTGSQRRVSVRGSRYQARGRHTDRRLAASRRLILWRKRRRWIYCCLR